MTFLLAVPARILANEKTSIRTGILYPGRAIRDFDVFFFEI
jgi:hypothetical protein